MSSHKNNYTTKVLIKFPLTFVTTCYKSAHGMQFGVIYIHYKRRDFCMALTVKQYIEDQLRLNPNANQVELRNNFLTLTESEKVQIEAE
jgi:hypothetical protein